MKKIVVHFCKNCFVSSATYEGRIPKRWQWFGGMLLCGPCLREQKLRTERRSHAGS